MLCLIIGGRGFLGSHVGRALLARGHRLRLFDRPAVSATYPLEGPGVEQVEGDFLNAGDLRAALQEVGAVVHLASTTVPKTSNDDPVHDVETNLVPTLRLLEEIRRGPHDVKVLFASSGGTIYGIPETVPVTESHPTAPQCAYGICKLAIEHYLRLYHALHGLRYCVLRLANPYGEGQRPEGQQGAVGVFASRALRGEPVEIWGDGSVVRDYIHAADVADAFARALDYGGEARVFNIGSCRGHSLIEIVEALEKVLGRGVARGHMPGRPFDIPVNVLDISRARRELGWQPTVTLENGLTRTLAWLRHYHRL